MTGIHAKGKEPHQLLVGEYAKWHGVWYARAPVGDLVANLGSHAVMENDDGTITVSPSILVTGGKDETWHGYLDRGVWRSV